MWYSVVSVLFNEPKLLKLTITQSGLLPRCGFSALQRAEIAEIEWGDGGVLEGTRFSALQRAEIAEIATATATLHIQITFQCSSTSRNC